MVVSIYKSDRECSFERMPGATPVRVKVPAGSELLRTHGLGVELFVPMCTDKRVRMAWSAKLLLNAASRNPGVFKVVQASRVLSAP